MAIETTDPKPEEETEPTTPVPKIPTIELKVVKPSDIVRWLKFLVYGDTGAGKTVLLGSASAVPEMCPVLYCDLEAGTLSIRGTDVDVVSVDTMAELSNAFNYVRTHIGEYKTIAVDTISEVYSVQMRQRLRNAALKDPRHDQYVPEMQDWLHSTMRMRSILRVIRAMPCHVLVAATPTIVEDQMVGEILKLYPDLPGKLAPEVGKYFDIVGYLYTKLVGPRKLVRELQCQPYNRIAAKDRSGQLGAVLVEPTMAEIFRLATGAIVVSEPEPAVEEEVIE